MEATAAVAPEKALVLAVAKCMLYGEDPPYMGVGLMYKPHYISTESFCTTYMHLNVWHAAGSEDKLDSSRFILVTVSEMSNVIPVAVPHPVFLDVGTKEAMERTGGPLAPLWFCGFRLHTVWNQPPGGGACSSGHFSSSLRGGHHTHAGDEPEKFPQNLLQGPKMSINLRSPSREHWNIESDLILPSMIDTYEWQRDAKRADQDPERESVGAEASPEEVPAPEKAPQTVAGGSKAASPTETTRQGERDLKTTLVIVECIHALRLQILHEMGGVRELEQVAVHTLIAEFARLQLISCEDLTKSLSALRSELEASSEVLSADILNVLNLHPGDPAFTWVRELIQKHHQSVSMKVNLPFIELEVAKEDLERFLQGCLHELSSDPKAWEVVEEISQILSSYGCRVQETILVPGIEQPSSCASISHGSACGSCSLPRDPGRVVWEARLDASRCS